MSPGRPVRVVAASVLLVALSACATSGPPRPIPETHTLVPGSRVSIAAPPGLILDAALPGFGSPDGQTAIFVNEVPGSVYATMRSFSGEGFQKTGMQLRTQERVTVDGWPARLYRASQTSRDTELGRFVLVFGDSSRSVVLTAVTSEAAWAENSAALRAALLSARWHRGGATPSDPRGAAGS